MFFFKYFVIVLTLLISIKANAYMLDQKSEQVEISKIFNATSKFAYDKYRLDTISWGTSDNSEEKIKTLEISFHSYQKLGLNETRRIVLELSQFFLSSINNSNLVASLSHYPFTHNDIDLTIGTSNSDGTRIVYPDFELVSLYNNKIVYFYIDPEDNYVYKEKKTETYEEAIEKDKLYNSKNN
jgi:hypothetical protein